MSWLDPKFGYEHWQDSHFGYEHWQDSHFGCEPELTGDTTATDFGLDPISLTVLGLGAAGMAAATTHHALAAHHLWNSGRAQRRAQAAPGATGRIAERAAAGLTDADNEFEALQIAAQTDPYALGQPL